MNAMYPFDRADKVNGAQIGPPPVAGFFHEHEPPQPEPGTAGRTVTAEIATADFEVQQFQPVFQAGQAQEFGIFR